MKKVITETNGRVRVVTENKEPSKTQQQFAEQTDINYIVRQYKKTGQWLHATNKQGIYADVSQITDFYESVNKVNMAMDAFMTLPSNIRTRFNNDPGQLLAFLQDPNNHDEGVELGLYEQGHISEQQPQPNKNELNENQQLKAQLADLQSKLAQASTQQGSTVVPNGEQPSVARQSSPKPRSKG